MVVTVFFFNSLFQLSVSRDLTDLDNSAQTIYDLEDALSKKQMEIEILQMIASRQLNPKPIDAKR